MRGRNCACGLFTQNPTPGPNVLLFVVKSSASLRRARYLQSMPGHQDTFRNALMDGDCQRTETVAGRVAANRRASNARDSSTGTRGPERGSGGEAIGTRVSGLSCPGSGSGCESHRPVMVICARSGGEYRGQMGYRGSHTECPLLGHCGHS